jgi:ribosomal protein S14
MILKKAYDIKIRKIYKRLELQKKIFKFLILNFNSNPVLVKKKAYFVYNFLLFQKKQLKFSKTKLKNRCKLTNRTQGIVNTYGISRLKMREFIQYGVLPGYTKAVW